MYFEKKKEDLGKQVVKMQENRAVTKALFKRSLWFQHFAVTEINLFQSFLSYCNKLLA